jgi:UDP-N-acetylmuramyl pentapeptide phosphotransferase/UDP-N-acetylglucosamine-1-phosphate transferase/SAM-dependent methyltransferase
MLTVLPVEGMVVSFLLALLLTPLFKFAAPRVRLFTDAIPPVGGLVFLVSICALLFGSSQPVLTHLVVGVLGVCFVGFLDDLKALSPRPKTVLLLVILTVSVLVGGGREWTGLATLDLLINIAWLLWMCNAFNVLDAVDGLSGGVGAVSLGALAFIAGLLGLPGISTMCALLAACLVAYLCYNFHPARVYMGDTGSLLIGFLLGETALEVSGAIGGAAGVSTALLLVAVPCFEGVFLILIRIAKVTMPSVATYDHPTQRLIQAGCSIRSAVLKMYALTAILAFVSVVVWQSDANALVGLVLGLTALLATGIWLGRVDTVGDGVDGRPGSVFSKNWLVHRIVHRYMLDNADRAAGTLVDLGCGRRPYERLLSSKVERYFGVDLNRDRYADGTIDVVSDLDALGVGTGKADTVLSNQALEHVPEPSQVISEVSRVLKPGGVAIITAPHIWGIHEEPHDYFRFTPFGLRHLAEKSGLQVERVEPMGGYWVTAAARFCYYIERFDRGVLRPAVAVANYAVQSAAFVLDHFHRVDGDAWNHLMIAVKPRDPAAAESVVT